MNMYLFPVVMSKWKRFILNIQKGWRMLSFEMLTGKK